MKKIIYILLALTIIITPYFTFASNPMDKLKEVGTNGDGMYKNNATLSDLVGNIVKTFLSLLTIIFLLIVVINGYKYMMAGGNEDKIKEALAGIKRGIIGLIIIISAWGITYFVIKSLTATSAPANLIIST